MKEFVLESDRKEPHVIVPENAANLSSTLMYKVENISNNFLILLKTLLGKRLRLLPRGSSQQDE